MLTQREFVEVQVLRAAGWTIGQIAEHVGYHPATVSGWLKNGGPSAKRSVSRSVQVIDERWRERIGGLLAQNASLQATSIMRIIAAEGFDGSYPSLTRYLRTVRGTLRGRASAVAMSIDPAPRPAPPVDATPSSSPHRTTSRWL